eukprot:GHVS01058697.1.p1 GENE.GHVS01058697.1~~GHVS01058697.1.p1  ORF type:complete len:148 (-),score=12.10 GHVS01058697.1:44-487(-)
MSNSSGPQDQPTSPRTEVSGLMTRLAISGVSSSSTRVEPPVLSEVTTTPTVGRRGGSGGEEPEEDRTPQSSVPTFLKQTILPLHFSFSSSARNMHHLFISYLQLFNSSTLQVFTLYKPKQHTPHIYNTPHSIYRTYKTHVYTTFQTI